MFSAVAAAYSGLGLAFDYFDFFSPTFPGAVPPPAPTVPPPRMPCDISGFGGGP